MAKANMASHVASSPKTTLVGVGLGAGVGTGLGVGGGGNAGSVLTRT